MLLLCSSVELSKWVVPAGGGCSARSHSPLTRILQFQSYRTLQGSPIPPHVTEEETEAQRVALTACSRAVGWWQSWRWPPHLLTAPLSVRLLSPVWLLPSSSPDPSRSLQGRLCGPAPRLKGKPAHFITLWVPLPVKIFFCALTLETVLSTKQWLKSCRIYRDAAAAQWEVIKT